MSITSSRSEGRIAIVTIRGMGGGGRRRRRRDRWSQGGSLRERSQSRNRPALSAYANCVVLAPAAGVKPCGGAFRPTGRSRQQSARRRGQQSSSPRGDHDISRSNHCAGKAGHHGCTCVSPVSVYPRTCTGAHGCQPVPGLPCALRLKEGEAMKQNPGATCRGIANSCVLFES